MVWVIAVLAVGLLVLDKRVTPRRLRQKYSRENYRRNWSGQRYTAPTWLAFATGFTAVAVAFGVFAPLWLAVIGAIEFGVMAAVCYVQTVRALQRRTP